jgi:hypothetical protein
VIRKAAVAAQDKARLKAAEEASSSATTKGTNYSFSGEVLKHNIILPNNHGCIPTQNRLFWQE